jgi:hypothetical protein
LLLAYLFSWIVNCFQEPPGWLGGSSIILNKKEENTMGNPIQDWLDKFKTTSQTASGQSGVGTTGKATASGTASVGSTPSQTVNQVQRDAIGRKTNQELINAAYKVADELKLKGGPWPLLRAAGWGRLTEKRGELYKGKAIDELDKLTPEQKAALKRTLGL